MIVNIIESFYVIYFSFTILFVQIERNGDCGEKRSNDNRALACLIASMSWGAMFPVADHALEYIDPFIFAYSLWSSGDNADCIVVSEKKENRHFV